MKTKIVWKRISDLNDCSVYFKSEDLPIRFVRAPGGAFYLEVETVVPLERDITDYCGVKLVKSRSSSGWYIQVYYNQGIGNMVKVGIVGLPDGLHKDSNSLSNRGYRIEKCPDSTLSFKVFKLED